MIKAIEKLIAIIHIRWIQYRYKHLTLKSKGNQSNQNLNKLRLLQAKEFYYSEQFKAWGKYHYKFWFSKDEHKKYIEFREWLFPEKDFEEIDVVVWYNPEAVTYYRNLTYKLRHNTTAHAIKKQLNKWRLEEKRNP